MSSKGLNILRAFGLAALIGAFAVPLAAQETGTVQGTVTQTETGEPLAGAQVFIADTGLGSLTDAQGQYQILNVPAGEQLVQVQLIGYGEASQTVTVTAGAAATADFTIEPSALELQEVVVTGVSGQTIKAKVPFAIATVDAEDIKVAPVTATAAIQGKVAGATVVSGSGRPGSPPSILLRGAKSINASGRDQEPLYIVDGVILGSSMVDIDGLDIANIEIVKGAAAASLYGSRAANGVVQITTRRGASVPDDEVRYTVRTMYGESDLPGEFWLTRSHVLALTDDGQQFIDAGGNPCPYLECDSVQQAGQTARPGEAANSWNSFQNNPWPGQTYNQVERFFQGGAVLENYISASGRSGATNFHVSFSNTNQDGVFRGQSGFKRNNFRVNLDQSIMEQVQISASAFYSQSENDASGFGTLFDLTRAQAGVNLYACEDDPQQSCENDPENIILVSDPQNTESPNPIYEAIVRDYTDERARFLGSVNATWSPVAWFDIAGNASYDRLDREQTDLYPSGYRTIGTDATLNDGNLEVDTDRAEALNASATATLQFNLNEFVSNRTQFRYLYEQQDESGFDSDGYDFAVADIVDFDNLNQSTLETSSYLEPVRADGYYAITNFDILDRYIIDALVRNDGSSLFGPDERRQWYYRLAGAWRMAEEPWFTAPAVDELKLRAAYGTAGSRPNFYAQYETYDVSGGRIVPVNLGNTALRPEHSAEQEYGVDASFLNGGLVLGLTYASTTTTDQILQVPLPAYSGYSSQWRNAGTLESSTWEASLDGRLLQTDNFSWTARVLFDRTRSTITELDVPPYTYGTPGQGLGTVYYARPGEELGTFYGVEVATDCSDLPSGTSCDGFMVNNDGYLVWVGQGNTPANGFGADGQPGTVDDLWGTDSDVLVRGAAVRWGTPFAAQCTDRSTGDPTLYCPVGNSMPDFHTSLSSTVTWRGLSVYGLLDAERGFEIYNQPLQWAVFRRTGGPCDQAGIPLAEAKPIGYCDQLYQVSGLQPSSIFVEDGSYVKLRELAVRYRFGAEQLGGLPGLNTFSDITLSLTGRNLITWTDYRGYDPETGVSGGDTGSAALARVDGYQYPNFRTWQLGIELNF